MQVNKPDAEQLLFRLDVGYRDQTPPRGIENKLTKLWNRDKEARASVHSWPSKKELNEFQVLSTSAPSAISVESHPLAKGAGVEHPLLKLLKIADSKSAKTRFKEWEELLRVTKTQQVAAIALQSPPKYLADLGRFTLKVGDIFFSEKEFQADPERPKRVATAIQEELWKALSASRRFDAKAFELMRYMVQDLLEQSLFAIDPEFVGKASQSYSESGQLLVGLAYDEEILEAAKKTSFFGVSAEPDCIVIRAVQYWKVVNAALPSMILGFDAHCVNICINVTKLQADKLLLTSDAATVSVMFHGFRPRLDHIAY